jgi:two-component system, NarL family, sensor histidine kinase EvgS
MREFDDRQSDPPREDCIDPALLRGVVGGDIAMARELIEDLLPSARGDIDLIHRAAAHLQLPEVRMASHKLKGSASLVGARHLVALCADLQAAAAGGDAALVNRLDAQLDLRLREVEAALESFLAGAAGE